MERFNETGEDLEVGWEVYKEIVERAAENYRGVFRESEHKLGYIFQYFREAFVEDALLAG